MKITKTSLNDLYLIEPTSYKDERGIFLETFNSKIYKKIIDEELIQDNFCTSKKNVVRGMHMQTKFSQGKYVSVLKGAIFDVVVDIRKNSKNFGKHYKTTLSEDNAKSIYIPPGFAHGFLGLKKENIIYYTCTNYRSEKHEIGILWNDKDLKIKWPIKKPIISKKDKKNIKFKDFKKKYIK